MIIFEDMIFINMRKLLFLIIVPLMFSCSNKKSIIYIGDSSKNNLNRVDYSVENKIEIGDILKIDITTVIPEASSPYSKLSNNTSNNIDFLVIDGYLVDKNKIINFPILGEVSVAEHTESKLAQKITQLLVNGGHLSKPHVKVKKINSKFTILGEVRSPGTYSFYDDQINIFQALGHAGDLLISAKRENITLIREENGLRKVFKFSLTKSDLFNKPYYFMKNNDVIIIEPNFSKVKSAGFIGSPQSIASISSLLLSITLLLINN